MLKDKRGLSLGDLYPAVLLVVVIGIALGLGIFILDETGKAISSETFTVNTENITVVTTGVAVSTASTACFNSFVVTGLTNITGVAVTTDNYTVIADSGRILNISSDYGKNDWTINYTYKADATGGNRCTAITTTSTGVAGFASWISIIVVVIAAAVVLGIVISSFGGSRAV